MKVLLAEDEKDLNDVLSAMLTHSGYEVDSVLNGAEAVEHAKNNVYDAIVMDIMMPVMDGITALKEIRSRMNMTPVLLLTAKTEVSDRITGLDAGADDYLTKPFAMGELLARVRALTRRHNTYTPRILTVENVTLNLENAELSCLNSISLATKEIHLMELLMSNPEVIFSSEEIVNRIWQDDEDADSELVWMYISFLRNKLKAVGSSLQITGERGGSFCLTSINI